MSLILIAIPIMTLAITVMVMTLQTVGDIDCDAAPPNIQTQCHQAVGTAWVMVLILPALLLFPVIRLGLTLRALNIDNIEKRAEKLQKAGVEKLLRKTKAKLIDKSKRGNELYEINMISGYPLKYLKYEDPSTPGKIYGCFVPTNMIKADQAMAWKFYITEEEYDGLIIEA